MLFLRRNYNYLVILISTIAYFYIAYFFDRSNFSELLFIVLITFLGYFSLLSQKTKETSLPQLVLLGVLFRCIFLFSLPSLSDDYFRYLWDGHLLNEGLSPFLYTPKSFLGNSIEISSFFSEVFPKLNSPDYFSVYPPISQLIFWLSASASDSVFINILCLRSFVFTAELITLFFLQKTLRLLRINQKRTLLYWLNPLIIIELSGNLHTEVFMICFLSIAFYFLIKERVSISAIFWSLAICIKFLPLFFLPLVLRKIGLKKFTHFSAVTLFCTLAICLPFFLPIVKLKNLLSSLQLYFQTFEFNASLYYLFRWFGELSLGYNTIKTLGPVLSSSAALLILIFSIKKLRGWSSFFERLSIIIFIYFLFSTTVHPWYISTLVMVACLSKNMYSIIWSVLVFLSYNAYKSDFYNENLTLVFIEYIIVGAFWVSHYTIKKPLKIKWLLQE